MFEKNIRYSIRDHLKYNVDCMITQETRQIEKKRRTEKKQQIVIETKKAAVAAQKTIEQETVVARKQNSKIKFNKFFKSFKSEEFAVNFNSSSTSTKSSFEFVIQSDVILAANSIFTSISKNSKVISSRSISSCSTSTIQLINQSSYLLVANQFVAQISYQHIVMTFFFNYDKRLTTFKK